MDLVGGGVDSRAGYVSKILYVKTKELGPSGGRAPGAPPRSANVYVQMGTYLIFLQLRLRITTPKWTQITVKLHI